MAHKKGGGSSRNGRDSNAQRLGVKVFGGQRITAGAIIVRQHGTPLMPGGGSVVLEATSEVSSLVAYVGRRLWAAADGRPGAGARKSGRTGADLRLPVPVGTVVVDEETGAVMADLDAPGAEAVVARGGAG